MKKGISSYTYTWGVGVEGKRPEKCLTVYELIDRAASHQLDCLQIADNLPLHQFDRAQLSDIKQYARNSNIQIEAGFKGLTEKNLSKYIEIGSLLDTDIVRFVIDSPGYKPSVAEVVSILKNFEKELKKYNFRLAMENHDRFKAREFETIIQRTANDRVGICLDTVNSLGAGEGFEIVTDILAPYTFNVHLKDFHIYRVWHMMGFVIEGKPLGEGMLPVKTILEKLSSKCVSAILEQWVPPEEDMEQTLIKEKDWASKSIDTMHKTINKI